MTSLAKLLFLLLFVTATARTFAQAGPSAEVSLGSSMVVVGEETYLTLLTRGVTIIDWPDTPPGTAPLAVKRDVKQRFQINGYIRDGYRFRVMAFEPGVYRIPPFCFQTPSGEVSTQPLTLRVFPVEDLSTHGIKVGGTVTPYLTGVFLEKKNPYVGEQRDAEAKLYLSQAAPNRLSLADGKVIQFEKDGLAAWRFTTVPEETGFLEYDGHRFSTYTYRSSVNALQDGPLSLGPGEADAVFYYRASPFSRPITFPAATLNVRPLPDGAPAGFAGAVGNFSMKVKPLNQELAWGDTLTVEIDLTGEGNIDKFPGPALQDPDRQWKQFEMIAKPAGEERRSSSGTARFSQLVRPLTPVEALPPYRFVYFDPLTSEYRTLESPPAPLSLQGGPSNEPGAAGGLPFLPVGSRPLKSFGETLPGVLWWWQVIPALLVLVLISLAAKRRMEARRLAGEPTRALEAAISGVAESAGDRTEFYREAARVATRWKGGPEFEDLYRTRDEICFRPDRKPVPVDEPEKSRILSLLRSLTPLVIVGLLFLLPRGRAQALPDDPALAKEEILAAMKAKPDAGHYHNLAICEKALGNPGQAALWGYRFKLHGGDAGELLQNLPGSREKPDAWPARWIALLPRGGYLQVIMAGGWSLLVMTVLLRTRREQTRPRTIAGLSIFGGVALVIGTAAWFWYPADISYTPLQELAVVTGDSPVRNAPHDGAGTIRDTPVGSLCQVRGTRGEWARVVFPGGLAGWIKESGVEKIREADR